MKITKEGIEKLGYEFIDYDSQTDMDYAFEKKGKKPMHYFFLIWQPISNEITISEYDRPDNRREIRNIKRVYQGRPATMDELKNVLNGIKC